MKTVSHVSVKIDCDGVKKGEGRRAQSSPLTAQSDWIFVVLI